jgi:hypothetical protein
MTVVQNPYRGRDGDAIEAVDDVAEEAVGPGAVRGVAQGDVRDPQVVTAQHLAKAEGKDHSNMRLFGAELCMRRCILVSRRRGWKAVQVLRLTPLACVKAWKENLPW